VAPGEFEYKFVNGFRLVSCRYPKMVCSAKSQPVSGAGEVRWGGYFEYTFAVLGCHIAEDVIECPGVENAHREDQAFQEAG
jgi:hypothetical protein